MKVLSVEFGQVTWLIDLSLPSGSLYLPEVVPKLVQKYSFVKHPSIDELLAAQPNTLFQHGKFQKSVIRKFSVHSDGFVAESAAGTEAAVAFLNDFMDWAKSEFGAIHLGISDVLKIFDSHMVVQLDINLSSKFASFVAEELSEHTKDYGLPPRIYEASGFYVENDPSKIDNINTSSFRIERRTGKPFGQNIYYCSAPLQTSDHEKLLEKLERII